jgi:hypothetical protein
LKLEEPFGPQISQSAKNGVLIDPGDRCEVFCRWESVPRRGFTFRDGAPDLRGYLLVKLRLGVAIYLDIQHSASDTSSIAAKDTIPLGASPQVVEAIIDEARKRARRRHLVVIAASCIAIAVAAVMVAGGSGGGGVPAGIGSGEGSDARASYEDALEAAEDPKDRDDIRATLDDCLDHPGDCIRNPQDYPQLREVKTSCGPADHPGRCGLPGLTAILDCQTGGEEKYGLAGIAGNSRARASGGQFIRVIGGGADERCRL